MSNLKRFLAMALVMFMMVGALAMTSSAHRNFDDVNQTKDEALIAAIDLLSELGIAKGVSKDSFDPEANVTRQQFSLFVARIHSATPEYFVPSDAASDIPAFKDVVDKTYFTAVNYCYENQIINGTKAPDAGEKNGIFDPESSIIFQDAVKMLVSALGYANSGLSYPVGFLAKAKEIGLLEGFGLDKLKAGDVVKRADMAALLYNYFLNDAIEVIMTWNPVRNQYVANEVFRPVCEKFGITKIVGYVTAIEGAAIPLVVEDTITPSSPDITLVANAISMKMANANTPGNYNLVISYLTSEFEKIPTTNYVPVYDVAIPGLPGNTAANQIGWLEVQGNPTELRKYANFHTTKKALGLDEEYAGIPGSRELLGLKVVAFVNMSPNKNVPLPKTVVVGTKTINAEVSQNTGLTSGDQRIGGVNSLTVNGVVFNHRAPTDLNAKTVYGFCNDGTPIARPLLASGAPRLHPDQGNLEYMLGMVRFGGQYTIDYIDNGKNLDGTLNHAIIFTPFEVMYVQPNDWSGGGWKNSLGNGKGGAAISEDGNFNKIIDSKTYESSSLGHDAAWFISRQGEYVVRHGAALTLLANNDNTRVAYTDANLVRINRTVTNIALGQLSINFNQREVFYKALNNRSSTGGTFTGTSANNAYAIALQDSYRVYAVSSVDPNWGWSGEWSGEFVIFNRRENKIDTSKKYAYILSTTNSQQSMPDGTLVRIYTVYDVATRTLKEIYDVERTITPYATGTYIKYTNQGTNSHRITGAVLWNEFAGYEALDTAAYNAAKGRVNAFNNLGRFVGNFVAGERASNAFRFGTQPVRNAVMTEGLFLDPLPHTGNSIGAFDGSGRTIDNGFTDLFSVYHSWTAPAAPQGNSASQSILFRAITLYNRGTVSDWDNLGQDILSAIAVINAHVAGDVLGGVPAARTLISTTITAARVILALMATDIQTLEVDQENFVNSASPSSIISDNNDRIIKACKEYVAALTGLVNDWENTLLPAADDFVAAATALVGRRPTAAGGQNNRRFFNNVDWPIGTGSVERRNDFIENNEIGWIATNTQSGVGSYVNALNADFNGFFYNTATKEVNVGRAGRSTDSDQNFLRATVQPNTPILITDPNPGTPKHQYNIITRDQLDAMIARLTAAQCINAIVSATLVRDANAVANNGTAKFLALVLCPVAGGANVTDYLTQTNWAGEELIVTAVDPIVFAVDGVNYFLVTAYDYASKATGTYAVSAVSLLYNEVSVGSRIYLSSVYVTNPANLTKYRVAQLVDKYDLKSNILSTAYLSTIINNPANIVVNYEPSVGVTVQNGTSYPAYDTANIAFINIDVSVVGGVVTSFSINNDEKGLKVGAGTTPATGFSTKGYLWDGFNSIRNSGYLSTVLQNLADWPRTGTTITGTWYFVPVDVVNPVGGITLIYVANR